MRLRAAQTMEPVARLHDWEGHMNRIIKAVSGVALLIAGCAGVDPDEAGVPNGEDFEVAVLSQNGANLTVQVGFYDNFNALDYYMYFDHDQDGTPEFLMLCEDPVFALENSV